MNTSPLAFSHPYGIAFWATYIWAFHLAELPVIFSTPTAASPAASTPPQDPLRHCQWIWCGGVLLSMAVSGWRPATIASGWVLASFWLGLLLMMAGGALRRHCFRMLGRDFTLDVRARPDQPVVSSGAYAWVRHPSYSAGLLKLIGLGLALGNWASLAVLGAMGIIVYARRIAFEEAALMQVIGEKYLAYASKRKRLIPFLF